MISYFSNWKADAFTCPACGWAGVGGDLQVGEASNDLFELMCPQCDAYVTFVMNPTLEEYRANWDKVSELDKAMVERVEAFRREFGERKLDRERAKRQLPAIAGKAFTLAWDFESEDDRTKPGLSGARRETVIRLDGAAIFREPAMYEGYERFIEVAEILREAYGERVLDLVPTRASEVYLYGDKLSSPAIVAAARKRIFGEEPA
jgi:hypothetical protein